MLRAGGGGRGSAGGLVKLGRAGGQGGHSQSNLAALTKGRLPAIRCGSTSPPKKHAAPHLPMVMLMWSHDRNVRSFAKNVLGSIRIMGAVTIFLGAPSRGPIHLYHHGRSAPCPAAAAPKPAGGGGGGMGGKRPRVGVHALKRSSAVVRSACQPLQTHSSRKPLRLRMPAPCLPQAAPAHP
jgi:hypothetical protein